jgi:hypothetical protein
MGPSEKGLGRGRHATEEEGQTHILLLLVHVADLEPYVHLTQWVWRIVQDLVEALLESQ